jgi:uncharacterized repeat protein (TIGR03803 family)
VPAEASRHPIEFILASFRPHGDGARPRGALALGPYGSLFGTTSRGGRLGCPAGRGRCGSVFTLANTDSGLIEFSLYQFCKLSGCADGGLPYAGVTFDGNHAMYGTTYEGGAHGSGVVFKLTYGHRENNERVLYSFCAQANCADGSNPRSTPIFDKRGAFYGTTLYGGSKNGGVVFKLTPSSSGYTESVLHAFSGTDGLYPEAGVVADASGALYGTTASGGMTGCDTGCGVVYKLTPSSSGYTESVLHEFGSGSDGTDPYAGLVMDKHGNLFGVTAMGGGTGCGGYGCGVVFELKRTGTTYSESVLHAFDGTDGEGSDAALAFGNHGELYGTTGGGGTSGEGTVFAMRPAHSSYGFHSVYNFCTRKKCIDGATPLGGIFFGAKALYGVTGLFGTTSQGGYDGGGTVFEVEEPNR